MGRLCNDCGRSYDPFAAGYRRGGLCSDCTKVYEREKARRSPSRLVRNSARFKKLRALVKARDAYRCRNCGSTQQLDVHHIVPISKGGKPYDLANLKTLCSDCHKKTMCRPITQPRPRFSRQMLR
jgi:5-methylcytosine-specific restriction endonuclease McrA